MVAAIAHPFPLFFEKEFPMFNKPGVFGRNDHVSRRDSAANNAASANAATAPASQSATANGNGSGSTTTSSWNASPVVSAVAEKSPIVHKTAASPANTHTPSPSANSSETPADEAAATTTASGLATNAPVTAAASAAPAKPISTSVKTASSEASSSEARLIVGPDVKLKGAEILDCDTLVVEGRVEATMDSRVIRIAENGSFSGKVSIDVAEIHGSFDGELTARSQLIIHSTGRVSGTIRFGTLVVDEGGELCGDINVLLQKPSTMDKSDKSAASGRSDASPASVETAA